MSKKPAAKNEIYRLLESIASGQYPGETALLERLVSQVTDKDENIIGGRIWQLEPADNSYRLIYQCGKVKKIPDGFSQHLSNPDINLELKRLLKDKAIGNTESNADLKSRGINQYTLTGVGELVRLSDGKYFKYLLSFNADTFDKSFYEQLAAISSVATVSLRNLNAELEQSKYQSELRKAADIQRNLLPEHYLEFYDYEIFGLCIPDKEVGGDYFDYIRGNDVDEESLSIIISDAASKGLPAAIHALFVSGALRMGMSFSPKISHIMALLNNLLCRTFPQERFVSLFYCELTTTSNRLVVYSNAGHCSPLHFRASTGKFRSLPPTGSLLGIIENQKFKVENMRMMPGDILVLFTDGINEAQDDKGNLFGDKRIMNIVRKSRKKSAKEISYALIEAVQRFSAKSIYNDDKTIVVIKRAEKEGSAVAE